MLLLRSPRPLYLFTEGPGNASESVSLCRTATHNLEDFSERRRHRSQIRMHFIYALSEFLAAHRNKHKIRAMCSQREL
jgi:hypothetical protein